MSRRKPSVQWVETPEGMGTLTGYSNGTVIGVRLLDDDRLIECTYSDLKFISGPGPKKPKD